MALHQFIQRLLLVGARLDVAPSPPVPEPPQRLRPLIESLATAHREFDAVAIRFGHRYRSGFWAIYLLSAIAVLCAMMPLALGWDDLTSYMHSYAAGWVIAEILVIASVGVIYWRGHRKDWQGQWLRSRTVAELISYMPLIAPLTKLDQPGSELSWYGRSRLLAPHMATPDEVVQLCSSHELRVRDLLDGAWSDPEFLAAYARWAIGILQSQQHYHTQVARRSHVLQHRIHHLTAGLFALTGVAALSHLFIHSRWISMITTVFPALAAAFHGALAQSEAYRLESESGRVALELQVAADLIRVAAESGFASGLEELRATVCGAVSLILQEHQDWYMLVRPHHLPLA
jgi:hypothetical protein